MENNLFINVCVLVVFLFFFIFILVVEKFVFLFKFKMFVMFFNLIFWIKVLFFFLGICGDVGVGFLLVLWIFLVLLIILIFLVVRVIVGDLGLIVVVVVFILIVIFCEIMMFILLNDLLCLCCFLLLGWMFSFGLVVCCWLYVGCWWCWGFFGVSVEFESWFVFGFCLLVDDVLWYKFNDIMFGLLDGVVGVMYFWLEEMSLLVCICCVFNDGFLWCLKWENIVKGSWEERDFEGVVEVEFKMGFSFWCIFWVKVVVCGELVYMSCWVLKKYKGINVWFGILILMWIGIMMLKVIIEYVVNFVVMEFVGDW